MKNVLIVFLTILFAPSLLLGLTTVYQASVGFSANLGNDGWYYIESNGGDETYLKQHSDGHYWNETHPWTRIAAGMAQPSTSTSVIRQWVVQNTGKITITGIVERVWAGGDGVNARIEHNGAVLWSNFLAPETSVDPTGVSNIAVTVGDTIQFIVDIGPNGNGANDVTIWDPVITLESTGAPKTGAAIQQMIDAAKATGASYLKIPPGVYHSMPPSLNQAHITLYDVDDLEIDATGVTLMCGVRCGAFYIAECENLTIRGLTIDYKTLTVTQGTIESVGDVAAPEFNNYSRARWIDVKIDAGYPQYDPFNNLRVTNHGKEGSVKGSVKAGGVFTWHATYSEPREGVIRAENPQGQYFHNVEVGDRIAFHGLHDRDKGGWGHTVTIESSSRVHWYDVTVNSGVLFAFIEDRGPGDHLYDNVRIVPGPKPVGATKERLGSVHADGIHSSGTRKGPTIVNCEFEGLGDDNIHISGSFLRVLNNTQSNVIMAGILRRADHFIAEFIPEVGEVVEGEVVVTRLTQEQGRSSITSIEKYTGVPDQALLDVWDDFYPGQGVSIIKIVLDENLDIQAGDKVWFPTQSGQGYNIKNNQFNSQGRVLLRASNGVVESNIFNNAFTSSIDILDAGPVDSVVVRGNIIRGSGAMNTTRWWREPGAICVTAFQVGGAAHGLKPNVHSNITIEDNIIEDSYGHSIFASSVEGLIIRNNRIIIPGHQDPSVTGLWANATPGTAMSVLLSSNVVLEDNFIEGQGPDITKGGELLIGNSTTINGPVGVHVLADRSVGIEAENFTTQSGVRIVQEWKVGDIENGDWIHFEAMEIAGSNKFTARLSSPNSGGTVEVRSGSVTGPLLGSVTVGNTGSWWSPFQEVSGSLSNVPAGTTDIYLVFTGGSQPLFHIDWFQLDYIENSHVGVPIQTLDRDDDYGITAYWNNIGGTENGDWIRFDAMGIEGASMFTASLASANSGGTVEVRSGSVDGPLLGSVTIGNTGGWGVYQEVSGSISNYRYGVSDIYLVFTGGPYDLFNFKWFQFD